MNDSPPENRRSAVAYGRTLHVLAVLTACALFPLIFVGAGVTSKGAGMAYPDGFTSDGYLLRNPPGWWDREDTRWEHGHRVVGRVVGLLAIALAIGCWRRGGTVRTVGACNLAAVITQGLLGAFRVNEVSTTLAMVHGVFGQICFCLACSTALVTGRSWFRAPIPCPSREARFLRRLCLAAVITVFIQLVLGAVLRHFGSNIALLLHVLGAVAATLLAGWVAMWITGQRPVPRLMPWFGRAVALLIVIQLLLGGLAFTVTVMAERWSPFVLWAVPSAHVGVGAMLLACMVLVTLRAYHALRPVSQPGAEPTTTALTAP